MVKIMLTRILSLAGLCLLTLSVLTIGETTAQEVITATPLRAQLPTLAPPVVDEEPQADDAVATATRTPTVTGPVLLQARETAGEVNVRAEPDIEGELLGTIVAGDTYPVLGRYFRWIQLQYDGAVTGTVRAWVFDELVDIIGDESLIPVLDPGATPEPTNATAAVATQIEAIITQTPGGVLTATAESRILSLPGAELQGANEPAATSAPLPTFTYPPDAVAQARTPTPAEIDETETANPETTQSPVPEDIPPIMPIAFLGGLGLLGLAVSALRR